MIQVNNIVKIASLTLIFGSSAFAQTLLTVKVTDTASLEKCFQIQPYLNSTSAGAEKATEIVDQEKINVECAKRAQALAAGKMKVDDVQQIAEVVRQYSNAPFSLRVYKDFIVSKKSGCENLEMYKALKEALSLPADTPSKSDSFVQQAYAIMDVCTKNKDFLSDLLEDSVSKEDKTRATNICTYLNNKKIANKCAH